MNRRITIPRKGNQTLFLGALGIVIMALFLLSANQLLTQLSRIPANSFYQRHQGQFFAEHGADYLRDAAASFARIPPTRRGEQEWRRFAGVRLMQRGVSGGADAEPVVETEDFQSDQADDGVHDIDAALKASLARQPVQPIAWAYLADLRLVGLKDCASAMAALHQSYRVAPMEPDFLAYRIDLAVRCPRHWDVELLRALRAELLYLYTDNHIYARRPAFIEWVRRNPQVGAFVYGQLHRDSDALKRFETDFQRFSR